MPYTKRRRSTWHAGRRRRAGQGALLVTVVAISAMLSGCASRGDPATQGPASASPSASSVGNGDPMVCESVDTLFARMRADSVKWIPTDEPFDKGTAANVDHLSGALAGQARQARTPVVQEALQATATDLRRLSLAMGRSQHRRDVLVAVAGVRRSYSTLQSACGLSDAPPTDDESPADDEPANKTTASPPGAQEHRPSNGTCSQVQSTMIRLAGASEHWSPTEQPFDPEAARSFRRLGLELGELRLSSSEREVRSAIRQNAAAFLGIAEAIGSRHRSAVDNSVSKAQVAYANLERACWSGPQRTQ
jgi:hypothetical protein